MNRITILVIFLLALSACTTTTTQQRATENEIRDLFSAYGRVESVRLMTDRETGRLRGFGFVEMASGGKEAIAALNEKELSGRNIVVNEARPREERPRRERRW